MRPAARRPPGDQSATNSMADATYFTVGAGAASWSSRPCNSGRYVVSYIHPNGSTQGPPTSSAVQVNLGVSGAVTDRIPANRVRAPGAPAVQGVLSEGACKGLHARAARIMRELHPPAARNCRKTRAKPLGMVLVKQSGLDMKLRGIILKSVPEVLCPRSGCSFLFRTLFFPFDRCRGFL